MIGGVGVAVGAAFFYKGKPGDEWLWGIGAILMLLAWLWPRGLRWPYLVWMATGLFLGHVMSTILLTLIYFLAVTPLGLLARWRGQDFLNRSRNSQADSYWIRRKPKRDPTPRNYERQY